MLSSHSFRTSLIAFAVLAIASVAQAGPITSVSLDDCDADGCEGSDLFLQVEEEAGGTWLVTYTIDTSGYTGPSGSGFNQIGFKTVSGWSSATLESAPNAGWSDVIEAPINSNSQCDNSGGGSSKACIHGFTSIGGGSYTWVFRLVGGTLLPTEDWHLGAQYSSQEYYTQNGDARGRIISTEPGGPPIPEPSAALLFGVGAVAISSRARRR